MDNTVTIAIVVGSVLVALIACACLAGYCLRGNQNYETKVLRLGLHVEKGITTSYDEAATNRSDCVLHAVLAHAPVGALSQRPRHVTSVMCMGLRHRANSAANQPTEPHGRHRSCPAHTPRARSAHAQSATRTG